MSELGFWNFAQKDPSKLALVCPDGTEVSRGELLASCNRLVHGLRARGLEHGDCVATVIPNGRAMIELYLAACQAGWYLSPINHHLTAPEIAYIVSDSGAKAFVGGERFGEACARAMEELDFPKDARFAVGEIEGFRPFADLLAGQPETMPEDRAAGAVMNYTSGTTGKPKGVRRPLPPLDPDTVASLYTGFLAMFGIQVEDENVHLVGSPLYHTAVLVFAACSMHMGHPIVVMDKWTPEGFLALIEKYRVTTSHMVPTQFHRMLHLPEEVRGKYDCSSTRNMVHAAAPCPIEMKLAMLDWWGDSIYEYYAATEGGGTLVTPEEWRRYPGTVGRAWPTSEIKIFDDDGGELPTGEHGTVYMKQSQGDFEYHKDKEKTRKSRRGEYFTVGDIGYLNEEGYLFLCDRKSDMIISGGVNIYPAEIENVLLTHPKVADVAVFGIPHPDWGEEVKAVVQTVDDVASGDALSEEILGFCADKLAKYKTPRSIDYIEEMPRDPNGKLYKRKLRDPYWEGHEKAI
jgi:long-chain acyl-CoA synthetase